MSTPDNASPARRPGLGGNRRLALAAALLALAVVAALFFYWGSSTASAPSATASPSPRPSPSKTPTTEQIFQAVAPSVVYIDTVRTGSGSQPGTGEEVSGTGVIVNADGTILTANHVVAGAKTIHVTYADGSTSAAMVAADDPSIDIAELAPARLPSVVVPAVLGSSDRLQVGDGVVAIGNPLGLTDTTTTGVVSGLNRSTKINGGPGLTGLIQFDAAVNPGSSGGPLLNAEGQTVGIVVALANPTNEDTFIGIGFAVPIGSAVGAGGPSRGPQL